MATARFAQGDRVRFTYSGNLQETPPLGNYSGQIARIVRSLNRTEVDAEVGPMFEIAFENGATAHAFADELTPDFVSPFVRRAQASELPGKVVS